MTQFPSPFLPGKEPSPRLLLEPERVAALREGARQGATVVPAPTPRPLLRSSPSTVSRLVDFIRQGQAVNVLGAAGSGNSTIAIDAVRLASKRKRRILYIDLSRIRRSEEVARKILLAAGG